MPTELPQEAPKTYAVPVVKGDQARVAESPAELHQFLWDGYVTADQATAQQQAQKDAEAQQKANDAQAKAVEQAQKEADKAAAKTSQ